ncbi:MULTISPECIES: 2,3-butanediol dehydrogenase [Paenibacillus]|uniref:Alcohol dehydrogenase n=1 Tax=Paenibacillus naphthalenovorans TaxID=162209 RepID=A0A0U2MXT3_9BACL|nr:MULTISPECIES: 2,3-butanediol dehydrogenase [Paenibacillus]ALS23023.1 alcohol dehydrogenase [Paenibacillus naphthalenovorans]NTZ17379.1 2,3-butanediol dehydrogenase [Paenibacillus sp. JMULE4]GCL71916.1 butanediol dehydrogenase [Paenibacillus naphthalenovorans]SDI42464.1 (R,R)-butanediol dehydrogenase / meso-butanediol dehydrogenase / diacetyl reductase [Paenibacillus naphthalenovorans]
MKAAFWYGIRDVRIDEIPAPVVQPGMVNIKVAWCGICGTDLHEYMAGPIFIPDQPHALTHQQAPVILGHEFAGEVVEVGQGVTRVKVGDRVTVEPILACGSCIPCQKGLYNVCDTLGFHGLSGGGGGFSEFTMVKESMVHRLPDPMSYEQGALVEPAAVALHAIRTSKLKAGDSCVVYGAGPIGLLVIQAARTAGASRIIAVEVSEERQQMAKALGAHHIIHPLKENAIQAVHRLTNGGADICFEVTGVDRCLNDAIDCAKTDGQIIIVSIWEKQASIFPNNLVLKEREIKGVLAYRNIFPAVIDLISEGRLQVDQLITRKISLNDLTQKGFEELIRSKEHIKILVSPSLV